MALWKFETKDDGYIYLQYRNRVTGQVRECGCLEAGRTSAGRLLRWVVNQEPMPGDVIQIEDAVFHMALGRASA